jgi:hypothetical protein
MLLRTLLTRIPLWSQSIAGRTYIVYSDVVREAKNEREIYFLLSSYVEAVRFGDLLNLVPEPVKRLPLEGYGHVKEHYQQLLELEKASGGMTTNACGVIREALPIFNAALERLESLSGKHN